MGLQLPTTIPALNETEKIEFNDKIIHARLFALASAATWLISEYDEREQVAFIYCDLFGNGQEAEWGYVSIAELESLSWCGVPRIEVDVHFSPKPFRDCVRADGSII